VARGEAPGGRAVTTGVTSAAWIYRPTKVADDGISAKLGINLAYLRRLRDQRPDLWDANVNGWLHGNDLARYSGAGRNCCCGCSRPK
jgi:hypothetical protein